MNRYGVIYRKNFPHAWMTTFPKASELHENYVLVKVILAEDLEDVFEKMQGEVWSPHGEARGLIQSLGLSHTSMMIGDVILDIGTNEYWIVTWDSFQKLEK